MLFLEEKLKKIYGIGTGPGDPELLTLKAVRKINEADVIFAPNNKGKNIALDTAAEFVKDKKIVFLDFPMGRVTEETYKENARIIESSVGEGEVGAFLTIGDPTYYSTFINIMKYFEKDSIVEIISGIPSFVGAAGRAFAPLAFTGEEFSVVDEIPMENPVADSLAILKTFKLEEKDLDRLEEFGFEYQYIKRASHPDEVILTDKEEILKEKDYISLILARRKK